jgi:zinc metalloprotease ZmpB
MLLPWLLQVDACSLKFDHCHLIQDVVKPEKPTTMCKFLKNMMFVIVLAALAVVSVAYAQKAAPRSPLETANTHWDQSGVWKNVDNRVVDLRDGRIQSVSQLTEGPYAGKPEDAARAFLAAHKDWIGIDPTEANLHVVRTVESPGGVHVTFERYIGDVPVWPGNLVVTLDHQNYVRFLFSSLYLFTDQVSTGAALSAEQAERVADNYLKPATPAKDPADMKLVVYAGENRDFAICWKYHRFHEQPNGDWEVVMDANSGQIRRCKDIACYYVAGSGLVHEPDPLTSASATYGAAGYVDNGDANSAQLQAQRFSRSFPEITSTFILPGFNQYSLVGPWCQLVDWEAPAGAPVTQINNTDFSYTRDAQEFEDANVFYNIDKSQRWIQSLGFSNIQNTSIESDPHGFNGADNSHYISGVNRISWGEGGVDDAEDADVIWHEYGHGIQHWQVPGWGGGDEGAMGEGFGDYWAGSYSRSLYSFNNSWVFNWDGHNEYWSGRVLNANYHYPENLGEVHDAGMIWSQAEYAAETVIGRAVMNRIVLQSHFLLGTSASMLTAAQALITADQTLYQGQYSYAISDACVPRGLMSRPSYDTCPGYTLYALPFTYNGSTATADHDFANCAGYQSPDLVFELNGYIFDCNESVTVSLCGSSYDTYISVYTGGTCPGSSPVICNDDQCGLQSALTFTANAGQTYWVIVGGFLTYSGSFTLNVSGVVQAAAPSNDLCAGSIPINTLPYATSGSTCGANHDYPTCSSSTAPEVFYTLNVPSCQTVTVSLCGSTFDTGLEVRWGGGCPGAQQVACSDDYCGVQSQASFVALAGESYYILVHGFGQHAGSYTMNVTGVPWIAPNDACPGTTIASLPYSATGSTRCASNDYAACAEYGVGGPEVFYNYTPAACQQVTVSLCGSSYDTGIEVRAGGACPGDVAIACNDDNCGLNSSVTFDAAEGMTYYFIVHGFLGSSGTYNLLVTSAAAAPSNDNVAAPKYIAVPGVDIGSTTCATASTTSCWTGNSSNDVFYTFTWPSGLPCNTATVSLCGSNFDTNLRIGTGGACPGTTLVACDDDGLCGLQSSVAFTAVPGTAYYVTIDGYSGTSYGMYRIAVTPSCDPDSLVIKRSGNDIYLDWAPIGVAGPYVTYNVYRSTDPSVPIVPGNLIASVSTPYYTDVNRVLNAATTSFYAVTTDVTQSLIELPQQPGEISSLDHSKPPLTEAQLQALRDAFVPLVVEHTDIQPTNSDKVEPEPISVPSSWWGTPQTLPGQPTSK